MPAKLLAILIAISVMAALAGGCTARLRTADEVRYYVEQTYGKDFSLWPVEPDGQTGSQSDRPASSQTWKVILQEAGHDISFELRNYLTNSIQFLDGASFGPVVSRFESTYAIEKARAVHDQVLNIVAGFPDVEYVEDDNLRSDRFVVHNSNFEAFIACIQEIDRLYSFPQDTVIRFFATVIDRNDAIVASWLYNYSTGEKQLDISLLRPR